MWRALFLAIGGTLLVMGLESMVLDHAVLATDNGFISPTTASTQPVLDEWGFEVDQRTVAPTQRTVVPPEWAPWSMLSSGAIMLFYGLARGARRAVSIVDFDDDDDD